MLKTNPKSKYGKAGEQRNPIEKRGNQREWKRQQPDTLPTTKELRLKV